MARALALAERGRATTSPNPMVGALVVDADGVIVGRGAHRAAGEPHAEIIALEDAGVRAKGATLYCTLEPCSHVGRTGPCAPQVVAAGIRRAVIAMEDPNPLVSGRGLSLLRDAGIEVAVGVLQEEAAHLNKPFLTRIQLHRPFVTMKVAVSADNRVAAAPGKATRLTGPSSDRLVHRERAEVDAVIVGSETVLADDPALTPRVAYRERPLIRVVFDTRLRTPPSARLLSTLGAGPVIIVSTPHAVADAPARAEALRAAGADIMAVAGESRLPSALAELAARGLNSVVVEGGPRLHKAFWEAGLVDRLEMFITPHRLGPDGLDWLPAAQLAERTWSRVSGRTVGSDILVEAYVHRSN